MTTSTELNALADRVDALEGIIRDTLWMAGRYADGRMTYAVEMFNDARDKAIILGLGEVPPAVDGMRSFRALASQKEAEE